MNTGSATGRGKDDRGICCIVAADSRGCEGVCVWILHFRSFTAGISGDRCNLRKGER